MTIIICPIKTITSYNSLPTTAAKYTHARNVLTVTKRVERSRSIVIIKHKYMLMCNHKIRINLMRCLRNSTTRCEIGQWSSREECCPLLVCLFVRCCYNCKSITIIILGSLYSSICVVFDWELELERVRQIQLCCSDAHCL